MAITIPYSFTAGTPALSAEVNANFQEVATKALDKTGDTISGNITVANGVTIDGRDLSADLDQAVKSTSTPTFVGIAFPASQSPSGGANTLDDYEEGTFVPGLTFGGGSTGMTFSLQTGSYIKIGQLVWVSIRVILTAKGSSTGAAKITNLPFTSTGNHYGGGDLAYFTGMASLGGAVQGLVDATATSIGLSTGTATTVSLLSEANFTDNTTFIFIGTYQAAA